MSDNNTQKKPNNTITFDYGLEDKLSPSKGMIFGIQHLFLMLPATVLAPILLASGIGLSAAMTTVLVTATLFAAGLATLFQGLGWFGIGARLPVVQGTELYFIPPLVALGVTAGSGSIAFCVCLGGLLTLFIGRIYKYIQRLFPPLVIGTIITLIGIYLIPVGINLLLGQHTPQYGTYKPLLIGLITFFTIVVCSLFLPGIWGSMSILFGIIAGYVLSLFLGIVDFSPVTRADWISLPHMLPLGFEIPDLSTFPVVIMILFLFVITAIETTGYVITTNEITGGDPAKTNQKIKHGLAADGLGSVLAGLLGSTPQTAYAQNLGAVAITKVASRYVSIYAGGIILFLGFVPKVGAIFSTIPTSVIGGALLMLFGTISAIGIQTLIPVLNKQRNLMILAASLAIGAGFGLAPDEGLAFLSTNGKNALQMGVAIGALSAIVLNLIVPEFKEKTPVF